MQDRIRYVALEMGQGGLVPEAAETTWSRRFGDCKGKTALLLGILHSLEIEAEPVLVQSSLGDMIGGRLPMISLFDHVLVRAHIGGREYWLDGTRAGDTDLDSIKVPDFGWGLPMVDHAQLVRMVPPPLDTPDTETLLQVDSTGGVYATSPATAEETLRGDLAVALQSQLSALSDSQQQEFYRKFWSNMFDFVTLKSGSFTFDKSKRELRLSMTGNASLDWTGDYFHVPQSTVGFHPNFDRPKGPLQESPFAIAYPSYSRSTIRLRMPPSFIEGRKFGSANVSETLAGVRYDRTTTIDGNTIIVENSAKSLVPEITFKDAKAAEARLIALSDQDVSLPLSASYRITDADLQALHKQEPATAADLVTRGNNYLNANHLDDAIADFTKALATEPKNAVALADRALAYFYKKDVTAALKDLAAAESIDPSNAVLLRGQALIAAQKGDTATAIEDYSKSLEKEPGNGFALFHRSLLYLSNEQYDLAIKDVNEILTRDPNNLGALVQRADIYIAQNDYDAAKRDLSAAQSIHPDDAAVLESEARLAAIKDDASGELAAYSRIIELGKDKAKALAKRADAYQKLNRYVEALSDSDAAIKLGDRDTDLHLTRANIFIKQGKREAVAAEADAMIREDPNAAYAFVAAGKVYGAIGEQDKAMEAFTRALAIKPEAYIYVNRAQVRPATDVSGQLADLDQALKLEPKMPEALSIKASVLSKQGKYAEALALYDQVPKSAFNDPWTETQRALLLFKAGKTADAKHEFAGLRSKAKSASELNSLCWAEGTAGVMLEDAVQECREAVRLGNSAAQYLDSLGMALLQSGKLDDALSTYDQAIAKTPLAASYIGRAIIYARKGDSSRAKAELEKAKNLNAGIEGQFAGYGLKL